MVPASDDWVARWNELMQAVLSRGVLSQWEPLFPWGAWDIHTTYFLWYRKKQKIFILKLCIMLDKNTEIPIVSADKHTPSMCGLSLLRVNFSVRNSMLWEIFFFLSQMPSRFQCNWYIFLLLYYFPLNHLLWTAVSGCLKWWEWKLPWM